MNYFTSIIKNIILHNILSIFLILLLAILTQDLIRDNLGLLTFFTWLINGLLSVFIHFILFLPTLYWFDKNSSETKAIEVFRRLKFILLFPIIFYLFIAITSFSPYDNFIEMFHIHFSLLAPTIFLYSISLYTFIQSIYLQKNKQNEKNNKSLNQ